MQLLIVGVSEQLRSLVTACIFMADLLQEISQGVIIRRCSFRSASFLGSEKRESHVQTQNHLVSEKSKILGKSETTLGGWGEYEHGERTIGFNR